MDASKLLRWNETPQKIFWRRKLGERRKKRLQEPELRWRGEPERPESQFPPKRKWEGGKEGPGGIIYIRYYNNYIIILYYMIARHRDEPGLPWENNPSNVYSINSYNVNTVCLCLVIDVIGEYRYFPCLSLISVLLWSVRITSIYYSRLTLG